MIKDNALYTEKTPGYFSTIRYELIQEIPIGTVSVLEIGCGDGRLTWRYADRAAHVVAIDPKAEDIETALEDCPDDLRRKIEFRVARLEELEIPIEKFDLALLSWSL